MDRKIISLIGICLIFLGMLGVTSAQTPSTVCIGQVNGIINPSMADYIQRSVEVAETDGCSSLIFEMNTPGGLTSSTWEIGETILNAEIPIVVYISPQGASAGSAGVFITYAAHVAAMAPNTNIGAAHPVAGGGEDIGEDLRDKVTNDAVARITTWARANGRNEAWAEQAVRESVSIGSDQALELDVVDLVAPNQTALLEELDGRVVSLADGSTAVLQTADLPVRTISMSWLESILHWLGNPTIATLLISLGSMALYFEVAIPGFGVSGVLGFISLALGLYGLSVLPINIVGATLLTLAFVLFAVDIFATNHGALTFGGIASFVVGALLLVNTHEAPGVEVSRGVIAGLALGLLIVVGAIAYMFSRIKGVPNATGRDSLIGTVAPVRTTIAPNGMVFVQGALWKARSDERLEVGEAAQIVAVDGLTLVVQRPMKHVETL